MNNRLYNAFTRLEVKKQNKESLIPGLLGLMLGGEKVVEVPDRPGYVYVRIRNTTNELVMAFNDQVSPVYDLPVLLVRDDIDKTRYKIQGRDVGKYENWGSVSAYLPRHGNQHSFNPDSGGGGDIVWVYDRQLMPLALSPSGTSGSGDVVISPDVIFQQNGWRMVGGTGTASLLGYKPTGSSARLVLVYIDSNGNPQAAVGSFFSATITGAGAILPYMPSVPSATDIPLGAVRLVSGTAQILWDNIYDLRVIFRDSITATGSASKHIIQDDGVSQTERTYLNFVGAGFVVYDNGSATVVSGTASSAPGGGAPTYPAIFDDSVFKATGTAISFGNNLTVVATGTSVFIDSTGGGAGGFPAIYDDSVFKVTGAAISFGSNLTVAFTGTTAFIDASGGGGAGSYPAIYDDSVYKVTGSLINYGHNLDVIVTGSVAHVKVPDGITIYDGNNQVGILRSMDAGGDRWVINDLYVVTGSNATISMRLRDYTGSNNFAELSLIRSSEDINRPYLYLQIATVPIFAADLNGLMVYGDHYVDGGMFVGAINAPVVNYNPATGTIIFRNTAPPPAISGSYSVFFVENHIPKVRNSNGSIFVPINGMLIYDDNTFKGSGTAISFGTNLSVAVTGTTVFVDASGGGGAGGYPAIYDGSTFKATGSSISFGDYLSVANTGTSVYVDLSAFSGSNYLVYPLYIPGTLVSNQVSVFTVPSDLVLLEVQACGSNTNDGILRVGNSTNNAAYLADFSIGDGGVPVRKNLASDFVSGQFPTISAGTRMVFTLDFDGAAGTATQYFNMAAIFAGKSVISATGTLGTTPITLQNVATPSAPPSGYTTIFSASGTPSAIDSGSNRYKMVRDFGVSGSTVFVLLDSPYTSTSFDNDLYPTTPKTLIDLSSVFGAPPNMKAILARIAVADSGAAGADCVFTIGPTNVSNIGPAVDCYPANSRYHRSQRIVPCDSNGDVYYQVAASGGTGTATMNVSLQIWGYWI